MARLSPIAVPEPSTFALLGITVLGGGLLACQRKRRVARKPRARII